MTAKSELVRWAGPVAKPLKRLGPIGLLASLASSGLEIRDSIREICEYKKEIKKLKVEERQIDQEAAARHRQIDAAEKIATEELKQRSQHAREVITLASADLARTRIDRRAIMVETIRLSKIVRTPGIPTEERKIALAALAELSELQKKQMRHSQVVFDRMVSTTQTTLNRSSNLIPGLALSEEE